eukprot:scaffold206478_cov33-Tisochrysis_lutea.AAC.1
MVAQPRVVSTGRTAHAGGGELRNELTTWALTIPAAVIKAADPKRIALIVHVDKPTPWYRDPQNKVVPRQHVLNWCVKYAHIWVINGVPVATRMLRILAGPHRLAECSQGKATARDQHAKAGVRCGSDWLAKDQSACQHREERLERSNEHDGARAKELQRT